MGATLAAAPALGEGDPPAPVVGGGASVDATAAAGTGHASTPDLSVGVTISAPAAVGTGAVPAPEVGETVVYAPPALGTGIAPAPGFSGGATVAGLESTGGGEALGPVVSTGATVSAPAAAGTGAVPVPVVVGGVRYSDDLNRADAATLGTNYRVDRNASLRIASNRAQMKAMSGGDGRAGCWTSYQGGANSGRLASDSYGVKAQLIAPTGNLATDNCTCLLLAVADTFGNAVMCYFVVTTSTGCGIFTQSGLPPVSGITTGQAGQLGRITTTTNIATTDLIDFRRAGNVFTAYRNGDVFLTWTDASNEVASGAANRRWGLAVEGNYPLFGAEYRSPGNRLDRSLRPVTV
ncbi:hypothetical protein [Nocardia wallacei]|uniref:hypothetical protein n=1 Tax=Nocardia wallacei TaxID=480035 RepID=UPI002458747F|nr:hypothetical protein [Nocardia wallacei]